MPDITQNEQNKILEVNDLSVIYSTKDGDVHAVNSLNLSMERGKTTGLVGETGAGKTTLALSVMNLLPDKTGKITGGSIKFDGEELTSCKEADYLAIRGNRISMIFQDPMTSLDPVMNIGDQIAEAYTIHHPHAQTAEVNAKVDEMLNLVGISADRKTCFPHELSGGMKQRVVIAMALITSPELLIADEPTTALDVTIQAQVLNMTSKLTMEKNTSCLLITHNLGLVVRYCDYVSVIYAGHIVEEGTVEDVFKMSRNHPYTEGLLKCVPDISEKKESLYSIPGFAANPRNLPEGCAFADRCEYACERCHKEKPDMHYIGTHGISCHREEK